MPLIVASLWMLLSVVASAQDPVRAVQRAFRPVSDPSEAYDERAAALDAVGEVRDAALADALLAAWHRVHEEARAVERERRRPAENLVPSISEMADRVALNRCLRLMTRVESTLAGAVRPALDRVVEAALGNDLPIQARASLAPLAGKLGRAAVGRALRALEDAKRPDDSWVALKAFESLGQRAQNAGPGIEERLAHPDAIVRVQAARTIAAIGHRGGALALIDRLPKEEGRVRAAVAESLEKLTGLELGTAEPSWRAWWKAEGEAFVRGDAPRAKPKKGPARRDDGGTRGAFFGIPQDGRAVLYLVDFSKSMHREMRGEKGLTRWEACLRELGQAIERLGPDRTFNIVVFAQRVVAWSDRQMPADARSVAAAKEWAAGLELELGTAIFEAFEIAFALGGPMLEDRYFEPAIDTICFLSDGLPTIRYPASPRKLSPDDADLVVALVKRRNPLLSIVVHTVLLGRQGGGPLLRELAEQNRGTFVKR